MKSVYIHIPFCETICSYCDFCKLYYNKKWIEEYLIALRNEISEKYKKEKISTIYIGGGTPSSLSTDELERLFEIVKLINLSSNYEFTFECNIENINFEKLNILYKNNVNRLSIGVQTFNNDYLKYLNRNHTKEDVIEKINMAKKIGFDNINIDLIYAIPGQSLVQLNKDIDLFLELDINHLSTYSLIIEENTQLYINKQENIDQNLDSDMYELICNKLRENGFEHYEISNFAKQGFESKHNLTYWNNENYYGFGLGASGYINNVRYENTRNLNKYLNKKFLYKEKIVSEIECMENEFILGLRKITGLNKSKFYEKFNKNILEFKVIKELLKEGKLIDDGRNIFISNEYVYLSNSILINFIGFANE